MSSAEFLYSRSIYKKQSYLYLLGMNNLKIKLNNYILIASKRITYLGINFTKEMQVLHIENYKISLKWRLKFNNWKDFLCFPYSWIGRRNIVKMVILPIIYRLMQFLSKITTSFLKKGTHWSSNLYGIARGSE